MNSIYLFIDGFSIAILVLIWINAFLNYKKLPNTIPLHFGLDGKPDNYGNKVFIFLLPLVALILYYFLGFSVNEIGNYPVKITTENKEIQFIIGKIAVKSVIAYVIFIFFFIQSFTIKISLNKDNEKDLPILKLLLGLLVIIGFYIILAFINR